MRPLVVIGAGGFGRETLDVVDVINAESPTFELLGVADDAPSTDNLKRLAQRGITHLGGLSTIPRGVEVAVAVGSPRARRAIVEQLHDADHEYPSLIHPDTLTGSRFEHGVGLIALGGVSVGTNVSLGAHVHLNAHAVIGHDAVLDDYVSINPNATVSGEVHIGSGTLVGASATILQGLTLSPGCLVGAAACVTRPIRSADTTVVGIPAAPLTKEEHP